MQPFLHLDASSFAPRHRLEALQSHLFEPLKLVELVAAQQPCGGMQWSYRAAHGQNASFGAFRGDPLQTRMLRNATPTVPESVVVTWVRSGQVVQEMPDGSQMQASTGSLVAFDAVHAARFHWAAVDDLFLILPRKALLESLGKASGPQFLALQHLPLAPFLIAQLTALEEHGERLSPMELEQMLQVAASTARTCLHTGIVGLPAEQMRHDDGQIDLGLYHATRHYMQRHLHRHDLRIEQIAAAVACSRARLYRIFAAYGSSIHAELRELRLQAARQRIEQTALPIGTLAWQCGFADASAFSRLFRARFGASPGEWRMQHRAPGRGSV